MSNPKYHIGQLVGFFNGKVEMTWEPIVVYVQDKDTYTRVKLTQLEIRQAIIMLVENKVIITPAHRRMYKALCVSLRQACDLLDETKKLAPKKLQSRIQDWGFTASALIVKALAAVENEQQVGALTKRSHRQCEITLTKPARCGRGSDG